jgi:hypothetical protein
MKMNTEQELRAENEKLKAENEELKRRNEGGLTCKVSQKGGVAVYGLGRFPVTLYKDQWIRLLDEKEGILEFIEENSGQLKGRIHRGPNV